MPYALHLLRYGRMILPYGTEYQAIEVNNYL